MGLPQWLSGKESACNTGDMGLIPVGKIPWRTAWQPTSAFLPGESHGQRSLVGYSPQSRKELDTTRLKRLSTCAHTLNANRKDWSQRQRIRKISGT